VVCKRVWKCRCCKPNKIIQKCLRNYINYIQSALLSANVKTIQKALSFLNKLQIMQDGETRNGSNREPSMSGPEHTSFAGQTKAGTTDQGFNPRISGICTTEKIRSMIIADNTTNTLQAKNCRQLHYKCGGTVS